LNVAEFLAGVWEGVGFFIEFFLNLETRQKSCERSQFLKTPKKSSQPLPAKNCNTPK
jgi:hypothetical protein